MLYPAELRAHKKRVIRRGFEMTQPRCGGKFAGLGKDMMILRGFGLTILLATSGCAATGDFPSLAKRPFEDGTAVAAPAPPPLEASDAARLSRIARAVSLASGGRSAFETGYDEAQRAVAASGGTGSESWINAQLAISRLEPLREPAQTALANIADEQRKLATGAASSDEQAVAEAFAQVESIRNDQADKSDRLLARITRP